MASLKSSQAAKSIYSLCVYIYIRKEIRASLRELKEEGIVKEVKAHEDLACAGDSVKAEAFGAQRTDCEMNSSPT